MLGPRESAIGCHCSMSGWTSPLHESRRDVNAILAGIFAVPLDLAVEIGDREGLGKLHPAIALDPPDDVVGRGIEVRPAAMTVEFEFLAMRGHRRHDRFRGSLSAF